MAGRPPKCKYCNEDVIDKSTAYYDEFSKRWFCNQEHYKEFVVRLGKPSDFCGHCAKMIDKSICINKYNHNFCDGGCVTNFEKNPDNAYDVLLGYIHYELRNSQTPDYVIIQQQAEHFAKKYRFNYPAMILTCKYWHEVLGKTWNEDYHLGQIFPAYYKEAELYYKQRKKAWESMKNPEPEPEVRVVVANTNKMRYKIHVDDIDKL